MRNVKYKSTLIALSLLSIPLLSSAEQQSNIQTQTSLEEHQGVTVNVVKGL